jgi:folate-binding protein YgfZ
MSGLVGAWLDREVVRCVGGDATTFLQGQLSQDVAAMAPGTSRWSLVLQPQGRVEALVRVSRVGDDLLLDVEGGFGEAVIARLMRFKLRVDCELTLVDGWRCLAVRALPGLAGGDELGALDTSSARVVAPTGWPGVDGVDLLGPGVEVPGALPLDQSAVEGLRIVAGVPATGTELDESTIPAEAGRWLIDESVSFTKGCYVGQELVARVDSRGSNTPRKLRRLELADVGAAPGAPILVDGEPVGALTSGSGTHALGYVRRSVEVPVRASVGGVGATVEALAGDEGH